MDHKMGKNGNFLMRRLRRGNKRGNQAPRPPTPPILSSESQITPVENPGVKKCQVLTCRIVSKSEPFYMLCPKSQNQNDRSKSATMPPILTTTPPHFMPQPNCQASQLFMSSPNRDLISSSISPPVLQFSSLSLHDQEVCRQPVTLFQHSQVSTPTKTVVPKKRPVCIVRPSPRK